MSAEPFTIRLSEIQPSQLYVSAEKLSAVQTKQVAVEPVPLQELGGRLVLTDGHTRAVAEHLAGARSILACWETDVLDWKAYEICVGWCLAEGVRSLANLADRIVSHEQYEVLWYQRCQAMHRHLAVLRSKAQEP